MLSSKLLILLIFELFVCYTYSQICTESEITPVLGNIRMKMNMKLNYLKAFFKTKQRSKFVAKFADGISNYSSR